ncbi:MAG: hypothetical protein AVO33_10500 [delta proteobacterium ML8_F1]|nr:MAG: hypothetical protein AVO33_10500 [delta proteobacterium ML8_F1]
MAKDLKNITQAIFETRDVYEKIVFQKDKAVLHFYLKAGVPVTAGALKSLREASRANLDGVADVKVHRSIESGKPSPSPLDFFEEVIRPLSEDKPMVYHLLKESKRRYSKDEIIVTLESEMTLKIMEESRIALFLMEEYRRLHDQKVVLKWNLEGENSLEEFDHSQREKTRSIARNLLSESSDSSRNGTGTFKEKIIYKRRTRGETLPIRELQEESRATISGEIFDKEFRELKGGKFILNLSVTDYSDSIGVKFFLEAEEFKKYDSLLSIGGSYSFEGSTRYDTYSKELLFQPVAIHQIPPLKGLRQDDAPRKRVELHVHSAMSEMNGIHAPQEIIQRARDFGHRGIALTDSGVIQGFPEAMESAAKWGLKVIYGVEGSLYDNEGSLILRANQEDFDQPFVIFDIETTGFSPTDDHIIEIGGVLVRNKKIVDTFSQLVNPHRLLPQKIIELTGITDDDLAGKPAIEEVLPKFFEFVGDCPVVAHNAAFDMGFMRNNAKNLGLTFDPIVIDTLKLSRILLKQLKRHRLSSLVKHYGITLENHHRAVDDALATAKIFLFQIEDLESRGYTTLEDLNHLPQGDDEIDTFDFYSVTILAKSQEGLKNLYHLISISHLNTFYKQPRLSKAVVEKYRKGLLIGSGTESGQLYQSFIRGLEPEEVQKTAAFYDYFEIFPPQNALGLVKAGNVKDYQALETVVKKFVRLGELTGKPVVASSNVHFLNPEDEIYRRIILAGQKFRDIEQPPLYFKTTGEMLRDFSFLGKEKAASVVIDQPNAVLDTIDEGILPIPKGTYPPRIEGSDENLRQSCLERARALYGDPLPSEVAQRLERELESIISNGYAVMYIIAQKLVAKSLEDGYVVGSRGSVGSSLAATFSGITEVNPLPPHYRCPECRYSEFPQVTGGVSGVDLPDKTCPGCGSPLVKDGHDIPFEVFLGFEGDKEPDIDLNFAGVYQSKSHRYTEELFGKGKVYKAGTIGTIAERTAFGFVKNYFEDRGLKVSSREINRLIKGCTGIRRTTGQHPGGIMVVPDNKDIHDFTPIQHPANDMNSEVITTHFDYHSISGRILKLDILGHDVPTIIRQLENLTGVAIDAIPLDDPKTLSLFTSQEALRIVDPTYAMKDASLGIPEFGTKFVRQMLRDTKPSTFTELIRISGLSHGTDVWANNAEELIRNGGLQLVDVISTRDDIMNYLIDRDLPPKEAFGIMERVRKGKGLTAENIALMEEKGVPGWYIDSCNKIKYMFPKAHAVAYVMMSFRIAYYKVHHPLAFYATYFSSRIADFDASLIAMGKNTVHSRLLEIDKDPNPSKKDQDLRSLLEVVLEMFARGLNFSKIDLYRSHPSEFVIEGGRLLPPLRGIAGLGESVAQAIAAERLKGEFLSVEDFRTRSKASKTVVEALENHGALNDLPKTNQLQFMDLQTLG